MIASVALLNMYMDLPYLWGIGYNQEITGTIRNRIPLSKT